MKKKLIALLVLCICGISVNAQFYGLSTLNIGANQAPDPNWMAQQILPTQNQAQPAEFVANPPPNYPTGNCGGWVAPTAQNITAPTATYLYTTNFIAPPLQCGGTAVLNLNYIGADNFVQQIMLNGNQIFNAQQGFPFNGGPNTLLNVPVTLSATGVNVFQIVVANSGGPMALRVCGGITVTNNSPWPQTNQNSPQSSSEGDIINDVITDSNGDVYVTGTFAQQTTLNGGMNPDITISTLNSFESAYIAKYDACGNLLWESHTQNFNNSQGNAIALDIPNNRAYITGTLAHSNNFTNSGWFNFTSPVCGNPVNPLHVPAYEQGFVAVFDMTTGCIISLDKIREGHYTDCRAITVDQVTSDVFIGGSYLMASGTGTNGFLIFNPHLSEAFINQYSPSSFGIAPNSNATPVAISQITRHGWINDLDYDENRGHLWAIGQCSSTLSFTTVPFPHTVSLPFQSFFTGLETRTNGMQLIEHRLGGDNGYSPVILSGYDNGGGKGIAVDDNSGRIFLSGTYSQGNNQGITSFDPFSLGLNIGLNTQANKSAYMICYDRQNGDHWVRVSNGASAWGADVAIQNGEVCFAGDFSGNINVTMSGPINHNGNNSNHIFLVSYDLNGNPLWSNATAGALDQSVKAITFDNNNQTFTVGRYQGTMNYLAGTSAPLVSTGVNGYILRSSTLAQGASTSGSFRSVSTDMGIPLVGDLPIAELDSTNTLLVEDFDFVVYPNPANDYFTISNELDNFNVIVQNMDGKIIHQSNNNSGTSKIELNVANGIYLVSILDASGRTLKTNKLTVVN